MGDGRTYDYTLALRSVTTTDFMTADWARIPYEVLDKVSVRIVNEVGHINRIVYDRLFPYTKHFLAHEMQRGCKASDVKRIRVHDIRRLSGNDNFAVL